MANNEQIQAQIIAGIETPGAQQAAQIFAKLEELVQKLKGSAKDAGEELVKAFQANKTPAELTSQIRILQRELKALGTVSKGQQLFSNDEIANINKIQQAINKAASAYDSMRQSQAMSRYELGLESKTTREAATNLSILEKNLKAVDIALKNDSGNKSLIDKKKLLSDNKALLEILIRELKQQTEAERLQESIAKQNFAAAKQRYAEVQRLSQQRKESEGSASAQTRADNARFDYSAQGRDYASMRTRLKTASVNNALLPGREDIAVQRMQSTINRDYLKQSYGDAGLSLPSFSATLRDGPRVKALVSEIKEIESRIISDRQKGHKDLQKEAQLLEEIRTRLVKIENVRHDQNLNDPERVQARRDAQAKNLLNRASGEGGASLLAVQASLMANYAILSSTVGAMRSAVVVSAELEAAFRNVQAVTATSKTEMGGLEDKIKSVAAASRFTSLEVAEAALTLGQAGLSAKQVGEALQPVVMLASAAGTSIAQAVDLVTSVIGVFDKNTSDIADIANKITQASNASKISVDKMALALQYVGNAASQTGVSFEEVTAALAAMSNAGIKSGSTLGTGFRQFLTELQKPSEEFVASIQRIGLSMNDIDVKSNGLIGVIKRLREAGFVASDAIKSFDVRSAAAFNALIANPEELERQYRLLQDTKAGIAANEIQMDSLKSQATRLTTSLGNLASAGFDPLAKVLTSVFSGFATLTQALSEHNVAMGIAGTALASMLAMGAASHLTKMAAGGLALAAGAGQASVAVTALATASQAGSLGALATGLAASARAMLGITPAAVAATAATGALTGAITGLTAAFARLSIISGIGIAIVAVTAGFYLYDAVANRTAKTIDELKAKTNESKGAFEEKDASVKSLSSKIEDLSYREINLRNDTEALKRESMDLVSQFGAIGLQIDSNNSGFDDMIGKLKSLRVEMMNLRKASLENTLADNKKLLEAQLGQFQTTIKTINGKGLGAWDAAGSLSQVAGLKNNLTSDERSKLRAASTQLRNGDEKNMGDVSGARLIVLRLIKEMESKTGTDKLFVSPLKDIEQQLEKAGRQLSEIGQSQAEIARGDQILSKDESYKKFNESTRFGTRNRKSLTFEEAIPASVNLTALARSGMSEEDQKAPLKVFEEVKKVQEERSKTFKDLLEKITIAERDGAKGKKDGISTDTASSFRSIVNARAEKDKNELLSQADATQSEFKLKYNRELRLLESQKENAKIKKDKEAQKAIEDKITELKIKKENRSQVNEIEKTVTREDLEAIGEQNKRNIEDRKTRGGGRVRDVNSEVAGRSLKVQADALDRRADELKSSTKTATSMEELSKLLDEAVEAKIEAKKKRIEALKKKHETEAKQPGFDKTSKLAQELELASATEGENSKINTFSNSFVSLLEAGMERLDTVTKSINEQKRRISEAKWKGEDRLFDAQQELREVELALATGKRTKPSGIRSNTTYGAESSGRTDTLYTDKYGTERTRSKYNSSPSVTRFGPNGVSVDLRGTGSSSTNVNFDNPTTESVTGAIRETLTQRRNRLIVETSKLALEENEQALQEYGDDTTGLIGRLGEAYQNAKERVRLLSDKLKDTTDEVLRSNLTGELAFATKQEGESFRDLRQAKGEKKQLVGQQFSLRKDIAMSTEALPQEVTLDNLLNKLEEVWDRYSDIVGDMDVIGTIGAGLTATLGSVTGSLGNAFASIATGTKSVKEAFKDMAVSVIKSMIDILAQVIAMQAVKGLLSMFGMGASAGAGAAYGGINGSAGTALIPFDVAATGGFITPFGVQRVKKMAGGGNVTGGRAGMDSVPTMLMPGEFVLRKSAVDAVGTDYLHSLNQAANTVASSSSPKGPASEAKDKDGSTVNVWVVTPDQKPGTMGPKDVIAIISDDISRGGSVKKLIKQVQTNQV